INIIQSRCDLANNKHKKIFISHSSKDEAIIKLFVDDILQLGVGIKPEQIFCTSIEDMGIKNGEDIRKHIHQNIKNADYSFLLISNNYKTSEICLNEMGAVWAYDNNVKLYLLPKMDFDSIGWLCNTRIAERIDNSIALDELHEQLQQHYSLQNTSIRSWSRLREKFLQEIKAV
uniref:toll/interleukin-1 receptor domain-containing protein n=2 Tax=Bacteroidia TaxID=200643 RepID=UPI0025973192